MSDANMSPDASPGAVSKRVGVRRVNNWPMIMICGVGAAFLIVMILVAFDRANQGPMANKPDEKGGNSSQFAAAIAGDMEGGIVPAYAPPTVPEVPDLVEVPAAPQAPSVTVVRPENLDVPPTPPSYPSSPAPSAGQEDEELARIRMAKMQLFQEAVKAKTTVRVDAPRSPGSSMSNASEGQPTNQADMLARIAEARRMADAARRTDPTSAYKQRLAQLQSSGLVPASGGSGSSGGGGMQLVGANASSGGDGFDQFNNQSGGDRWEMKTDVQAPRTPYELRAGFVIPGTLISGINSDLPGQIVAQVSQDVTDTATGRHLLIPQGSRLVGAYSSDVAYGQSRVLVAWQRIIFPDGKALDIGSMPGADQAGYSGFKDRVNNHYFRIFGSALLMSGITAGVSLSQDQGGTGFGQQQTASSAMSEALGQQLGQVTAQLISKNLNVSPTLEIRPGYRFNVVVTKDLTFTKPYQSFDY